MNVLVIGSGAREHALVWKIKQSSKVKNIYCIPGNAGISQIAQCFDNKINDLPFLAGFAKEKNIDFTIVGPEVPLAQGIVDHFDEQGLKIFGPNKAAARLESSKVFSKDFMKKHCIPTASYRSFDKTAEALKYLDSIEKNTALVVKADGLAAGKGVIICKNTQEAKQSLADMMEKKVFGQAGENVVIEEFLSGEETSIMVFMDGKNYSIMPSSQDHKRVFDNDLGPNTGGMGAYAPAPVFDKEMSLLFEETIIKPIIKGFKEDKIVYKGVLYVGLMICQKKPFVLEFNCRFGDPETQVVMPLLKTDIMEVVENVINGTLDKFKIEWYNKSAVCIVLTAKGYPQEYLKGSQIYGLSEASKLCNVVVFHAGTVLKDSKVLTSGGRVLGVTSFGNNIKEALKSAYDALKLVSFEGMHYRTDIAKRAINRLN